MADPIDMVMLMLNRYVLPILLVMWLFRLVIGNRTRSGTVTWEDECDEETYTQDKVKEKPEKILNPGISSEEFDMRGSE